MLSVPLFPRVCPQFFLSCKSVYSLKNLAQAVQLLKTEKETKKCFFKAYLPCSTGVKTARKESRSSRKSSCVSFCDGIQWTPIPNNSNSIGEVNKGFRVSVLHLYSDESVEAKNDPLPETKANGKLSIYSGDTDCGFNFSNTNRSC